MAKRLKAFRVRLIGVTRDPSAPKVGEFNLDRCYCNEDRESAFADTDIPILCVR